MSRAGKPVLQILVDERGVRAFSGSRELVVEIRAALELLHNVVQEYFTKNSDHFLSKSLRELGEPTVWVPANVDGLEDSPKKATIHSAVTPRDPFDAPPTWFVEACRKKFQDWTWTGDYDEDAETAVTLFGAYVRSLGGEIVLDHWGWVEKEDGNVVMVSEPYGFNFSLKSFMELCDSLGWVYKGCGVSGQYPGSTLRIEVYPKEMTIHGLAVKRQIELSQLEWKTKLDNLLKTQPRSEQRTTSEVEAQWIEGCCDVDE